MSHREIRGNYISIGDQPCLLLWLSETEDEFMMVLEHAVTKNKYIYHYNYGYLHVNDVYSVFSLPEI